MKKSLIILLLSLCLPIPGADAEFWAEQNRSLKRTLPQEFVGVWIAAGSETNCQKSDWKGVAESKSSDLISISENMVEFWERSCNVASAEDANVPEEGRRTSRVELTCGGEGFQWRSSEVWHDQNVVSRRQLIFFTLKDFDWRDDSGKPIPKPYGSPQFQVDIYLECP